jgi:hypothetical protein
LNPCKRGKNGQNGEIFSENYDDVKKGKVELSPVQREDTGCAAIQRLVIHDNKVPRDLRAGKSAYVWDDS